MSAGITSPVFPIYGSGWSRYPWIASHFPRGYTGFVDLCCGAGTMTVRRPPAKLEWMVDKDHRVTATFWAIREHPERLARLLHYTPWSEEEFRRCMVRAEDPLEDARRFMFCCVASIRGGTRFRESDFRTQRVDTRRAACVSDMDRMIRQVEAVGNRLRNVQIVNDDAALFLSKGRSGERIIDLPYYLVYVDPPYLPETCASDVSYAVTADEKDHIRLAEVLVDARCMVILSGYWSNLYVDLYEANGWLRHDRRFNTNSGSDAMESIWINPAAQDAGRQLSFSFVSHEQEAVS